MERLVGNLIPGTIFTFAKPSHRGEEKYIRTDMGNLAMQYIYIVNLSTGHIEEISTTALVNEVN